MKRMKKVVAIALALLMVIGTLPNNLAMLNVNAETTALTIDGSFADWTTLTGKQNVTKNPAFNGAGQLSGISMTNDSEFLYVKVDANLAWDANEYVDIALDVESKTSTLSNNPWGRQFNYDGMLVKPDIHIVVKKEATEPNTWLAIYADDGDNRTEVLNTNNLQGALAEAYKSTGFTVKVPLVKLNITANDRIRANVVLSGDNAAQHGAFDVLPKTIDNAVASSWDESAKPNSQTTYTDFYTLNLSKVVSTDSTTGAILYDKLTYRSGTTSTPDAQLGDIYLYNDGEYLYYYVEGNFVDWGTDGMPLTLAINVNNVDSGYIGTNPWNRQFDFSGTSVKPQFIIVNKATDNYFEFNKVNESGVTIPLASGNNSGDGITVKATTNGFEGKLAISKLGLKNDDVVKVIGVLSGNTGDHGAFSVSPFASGNTVAQNYNKPASLNIQSVYSKEYKITGIPAASLKLTNAIPDTNVAVGSTLEVQFSEAVTVLNASGVTLVKNSDSSNVAITTVVSADNKLVVTPTVALENLTDYTLTIAADSYKGNTTSTNNIVFTKVFRTVAQFKTITFKDLGGQIYSVPGSFNGWKAAVSEGSTKMSRLTGSLYATSMILPAGTHEFKIAPNAWTNDYGDGANNYTIQLNKTSQIVIYTRIDTRELYISGVDEDGVTLTSSILTNPSTTMKIYSNPTLEAAWPRLVGSMQNELGSGADWQPGESTLLMYDYNLDGSVYKYEATMDASSSVYEAKVVLGKTWNGTDYGADGGNYKFTIPSKSTVIFETDLTATPKVLGAQITTLSFVNKAIDFNVDAVELDRREFKLTFENEVDLKSELVWYFYDAGDSLVNALIKKNAENPKEIIITLADGVVLQENSAYTIILEKGGIIETASQILSEEINIPFTTDSNVDPADIVKDTFVGLVSTDKYAVVGNFQQQDGETGNWIPDTDITVMKRLTGELYAYSTVLDAGNYEFKIVKNGNYDDPGSFAGGTGGYGNYVLTLSKRTKVNIYINAENRQIVTNVTIPNIHKYIPAVGPKLVGDIQSLFGETVWSPDSAKQVFYDYNLDGSDFRLERRILAGNYEAKAVLVAGSVSLWYGSEASSGGNLAVNLAKDMDVTFVIKGDYLSYAINVNEPKLAIDTFESAMIAGKNQQLSAKFTDEFNMVQDVAIGWSLKEPVAGVTISDTGLVTIAADVLAKTTFTVVASYDYNTSEFDTCNKLYTKDIIISVADAITNFKFNYLRYAGDYTGWNLWIWPDNQDGSGADVLSLVDGWYTGIVSIPQALEKLNFITRKGNWSDQEGGNRVFDLSKGNEVWLVEGDKTVYYSKEEAIAARLFYAVMDSDNKIDFKINGNGEGVDFSKFAVYVDGVRVTATSTKGNSTVTGIATLATPINPASQVEVRDLSGVYETKVVTMRNVLDKYFYYGNDLGFMSDGSTHTFKVWAPTAKKLSLSLYNDAGTYTAAGTVADHSSPNKLYTMIKDANTGVWTVSIPAQTAKYYMYKVEFADGTIDFAIDPYAKAVSANGQRAAIVDLDSTDPINWNPTTKPQTVTKDTDNILYELHIRDFSIDPDASFTNKGKYLAFTETGLKDSTGNTIGIDHLKELGITTVHLLPTYDFKTVNELTVNDPASTDAKFNWGYDPQNYNVPEGSFSSDATNPNLRITEFKQMVQALHDANIRVVMDVVYNHTFDIDNGPFDKLVPGYYYRTDSNIEFTNGSGCGNEVASERPMVRKYIVESVKYWAKEYNIDGFRFDLFGLIDQDTINQVTRELKQEIDPTIMVYGEPWTGGTTPLTNGVNKGSQKDQGYAVFNDDLRGAIKGGSDDASTGFATGATGKELDVVRGIYGSTETIANAPTETINYLTAHDNLNLWDKVVKTQNLDETLKSLAGKIKDGVMLDKSSVDEAVAAATPYAQIDLNDIFANETVKRSVFANSIILTLQGVPFIHAGDEFLRTKYGDHNSYKSPDSINMIRWENKAKFKPVTDYYAGLMELRKTHPAFRMDTKVALINNIQVFKSDGNIVAYALKNYANGDTWKNVVIIYNANTGDQSVTIPSELGASEWKMVVNGSEAGVSTLNTIAGNTVSVPGLSMVVLYDEERAAYVPAATTIEIAQNIVTIEPNKEVIFDAIVKDQYGVVITNPTITSDTTDSTVVEYVNGKLISKAPGNATITIKSGDVSKTVAVSVYSLSATINPYNLTSNENGVIEISSTGINIKTITADLSAVGGTSKYNVNIITKKVAFGIKDYIGAGIKEIPITITDINNKTYVVKAIFELATIGVTDDFEWDEAVIYFMVTDRFNDGNTDNNGVLVDKTNPGMYHGGDFKGVTDKLDYLKDLGINTIWITPIVENITLDCDAAVDSEYYAYHGYWANDFTKLNPYLGTKAELETLIDEAHSRGMKLMVDVVINHAGYDTTNPDFIDMFRTTSGSDDETMSLAGLPDFKTEDQLVRSKVIEWQVAWAALTTANGNKIDYFRVDTAKHVDHETLIQFKAALTETNPAFKMIGEIWADEAKINSYLNNGQMDSAIDFGFNDIVSKFVVSGKLTEAEALLEARNVTISNVGTLGQFLSSHDENGYLVSTLGNDANKMMLAASLQITAKGQPVIYYGEEIGASGTSVWPDYDNRIDLDWSKANDLNPMYVHYKKLLNIRADYSKVFAKGSRSNFAGSDAEGYLIFERSYEGKDLLVALNTRTTVKETTLTTSYEVGTKLKDIFNEDITYIVGADKKVTVNIPSIANGGTAIFTLVAPSQTIIDMIATLPIEITLQNKVEIESVRSAFTSLSVEQQLQVTNINVLIAAETKITELEEEKLAAEKLAAAITAAENAINSLPTVETVAIANKQAVADAKALVAEVKTLDVNAIVEGEEKIALLEAKIAELLIPVPTTIEVEQVNVSLERNDELAINIVVKDQFGNAITNPTITVESNSAVVEYLNGKLMAKSVGTATVTIIVGSISKEITVNVISKSSEADKNLENQIEELFYKVGVEFDNESNTITIKPLEGSQTGKIELSKQVIDTLNSNNLSLDVVTSNAIINVPASILKDIKTGSKIILDIKPSNDAVSGDGIAKVGNIVDINVFEVDGNNVSTQLTNFKALLTITIPVSNDDLAKVKNKLKLVVFYIDDEGNFTNMGGKLTDAGLEFTTNHLSKYVIVENHKSFIDVQGTWAQQYIEVLAARGIISGISADTFKPQATITRAEFAVLIAKTLGINDVAYTNEFSDVSKNAYYAQSIAIVSKQGIMVGNNGKFRPNDYITREEMTKVIIDAYAKIANIDLNTISTQGITSFEDKNKISTWALNYVNLAKVLKLINGTGENEFDPKSNLDRASASKVIFNLLEKVGKFN